MELVRAASLTGYFEVAEQLRLDVRPLLRQAGLSPAMMSNPDLMLPARPVVRLLEDSAAASGCVTFGLMMAERRQLSDLGLVSLLIVHQSTLRDAMEIMAEFRNRINSNLMLQIEEHEDSFYLREVFALNPPMVSRQVGDLALGVLHKLCRTLMDESWRPQCVSFSYERPVSPDRAIYDRLFDCPLQFGADFDGIVVETADMNRINPRADTALAAHARQLVGAMVDPGPRTIEEEVEQSIRLLMPAGRATIAGVADALGTNIRTLQRWLDREETSFSELLDRVRVQQVSQHFANRRLRLTDIAHLLGYSTLASFSAWYSNRFNETPTKGRATAQAQRG
ncbi:AraC family transcriptional regulator [Sphingomonas alba]|uniref:AraC family transcriptional regulator n=1 Tax=Sphingomonas alba TaxID=2908208 RepID=A0ABT0RM78_9SPHN|nr:AraC family transcriptional regulator [Sphingomonas alba]MCL6683668.1 AraC family transcriptional regulator [Sphingomonas alba]